MQSFGQENVNCPTIKLNSPSEQTPIGGNMNFSVSLMGKFDNKNVGFKWVISSGTNFNGQNTSAISIPIDKNLAGQTITATVEIKGLPEGCKSSFSKSREVETRQIIIACERELNGDSYWGDVMSLIQNLGLALEYEKGSQGVVVFRFTNSSELIKFKKLQKKLIRLAKKHKHRFFDKNLMKIEKGDVYEIKAIFIPAESK